MNHKQQALCNDVSDLGDKGEHKLTFPLVANEESIKKKRGGKGKPKQK